MLNDKLVQTSELIFSYFPHLTSAQQSKIKALEDLYTHWNAQINVISRKDIDLLYERHVLHSLALAKYCHFSPQERVLDVGTGGGFPGIPLAILFPETQFTLIDSIGKKIKVVQEVARALGLKNVTPIHGRAESATEKYHFIISRAVTRLSDFYPWIHNKFTKEQLNEVSNGVLYLKGGDLQEEIEELGKPVIQIPVNKYFEEVFFDTKYILHIPNGR